MNLVFKLKMEKVESLKKNINNSEFSYFLRLAKVFALCLSYEVRNRFYLHQEK